MIDRTLLDNDQVAALLHVSRDWWLRNKAALIAAHGFPPTVAGIPNRWDPLALAAWLDGQLPPALTVSVRPVNDVTDWTAELDRRLDGARTT